MSLESFWRIRPQQHTLCLSPCMPSPHPAAQALVCKGFQCVPLVDCNCPGSASNRRKKCLKKRQKEPSEVLSTVHRWWSHGSNSLRGVFGLVQIHRTASCQGYFKWAKNICKHTHPKTHAVAMHLQTHTCLTLAHVCSSGEIWGLQPRSTCWCCLSHSSVYLRVQMPQPTAHRQVNSAQEL